MATGHPHDIRPKSGSVPPESQVDEVHISPKEFVDEMLSPEVRPAEFLGLFPMLSDGSPWPRGSFPDVLGSRLWFLLGVDTWGKAIWRRLSKPTGSHFGW